MQLRRGKQEIGALYVVAFLACLSIAQPFDAAAQNKIRLGVVSDLLVHLPLFVAEDNDLFAAEKTVVLRQTKFGKFRTSTSLINGDVDIVLQATEAYFELADLYGAGGYKIIGSLTTTSGSVIIARDPLPASGFTWQQLRQKRFLGRDSHSTPMYFLRSVLTTHGVDPANVYINSTAPVPARERIWNTRRSYDYADFFEPDASQIVRQGNGYFAAMLGPAVGNIDSTIMIASSAFLKSENNRRLVQGFMNALQRSLNLIARTSVNSLSAIASRQSKDSTLGSSNPVARQDLADAIERYRAIGLWKTDLRVAPRAITDIQRLIIDGGGTKTRRHRCYRDVVDMRFAQAAFSIYPSGVPGERTKGFETAEGCG